MRWAMDSPVLFILIEYGGSIQGSTVSHYDRVPSKNGSCCGKRKFRYLTYLVTDVLVVPRPVVRTSSSSAALNSGGRKVGWPARGQIVTTAQSPA